MPAMFSTPPKPKKQDTSAQDAQLAMQKKQEKKNDEETAARARMVGSRAGGRQLLQGKGGDLGVTLG